MNQSKKNQLNPKLMKVRIDINEIETIETKQNLRSDFLKRENFS